jgi:hypothetical protein
MRTAVLGLFLAAAAAAADRAAESPFEKVQTMLERDCAGCHGAGQTLSGLDVRTREGLIKGGSRGPAVMPGAAAGSLLYRVLKSDGVPQMPPGKKISGDTVAAVAAWIESGANWGTAGARWSYRDEDLWAFRAVRRRDPRRTIDDFITRELAAKGLRPAPRADRRTLIRRATIDLTGLPPSPEAVERFVRDDAPEAWSRLIESLLASPRYGERWGRHWLDVVRYADTSGYSNDFERPNAWRYRDYVIRAFNADKPYDRFIREQVAGDELYPGDPEALIATGFLRAGPWEHTAMSVEAVTRQMFLDDVTHATAATFLGLTLGCARCHDHKFDPIPTRDYYRMQAVFATTEFVRPKLPFLESENTSSLGRGAARLAAIVQQTQAQMDAYKGPKDAQSGAGLDPEQYETFKLFQKHMQIYRESLDRYQPKAFAVASGPRDGAGDGGQNLRYPARAAYKPAAVHILPGGNIQAPADSVAPGVLSAMERYSGFAAPAAPETVEGRRSALANWIADAENPLTARVMANRVWQYHFGRGIAADANNFGKTGARPTHPELLDWLAGYLVEKGWSVKALHRAILLSDAYQRSSSHPGMAAVKRADPAGALLAYFPPRRVEAEVLRDSVLAVAGELNLEAGGPGVFPEINQDVARQPQHRMGSLAPAYRPSALRRERHRRTIYTFQQRSQMDPLIEVFNGPGPDLSCERRDTSTVPTQAFALLNGRFVHDMALAMAARVEKEAGGTDARIGWAFRLAFGRDPEPAELKTSREYLARMTAWHKSTPPTPAAAPKPLVHTITSELTGESFRFVQQEDPELYEENLQARDVGPETRALADLALVLLNSNEFAYVY